MEGITDLVCQNITKTFPLVFIYFMNLRALLCLKSNFKITNLIFFSNLLNSIKYIFYKLNRKKVIFIKIILLNLCKMK